MATQLTNAVEIFGSDVFTTQTGTPAHTLGSIGYTADGRKFRYVSVQPSAGGATGQPTGATLVTGNVLQAPAQLANHLALTPSAATVVGDTTITLTLGNTAACANQYAGGYLMVSTGPGNGFAYLIKSHPAAAGLATVVITLSDSIKVVTSTASRFDLQQNIYSGVIQAPITTATGATVGVAVNPIASATDGTTNYGWIQTHGAAAVLITGTPAVGNLVVGGNTAAAGAAAIFSGTLTPIGYMLSTGVTAKNNAVYVTLD